MAISSFANGTAKSVLEDTDFPERALQVSDSEHRVDAMCAFCGADQIGPQLMRITRSLEASLEVIARRLQQATKLRIGDFARHLFGAHRSPLPLVTIIFTFTLTLARRY